MAAPLEELGKSSGCRYATSAAPDVQANYAEELASRAAGKATKKKTEEHHNAILVRTRDLIPLTPDGWGGSGTGRHFCGVA